MTSTHLPSSLDWMTPDPSIQSSDAFAALTELVRTHPTILVTGAGCSTESGIPDYRSPGRPHRTPIRFQEFMECAEARRRYWARSAVGWARFSDARPNAAHRAIADLEVAGIVRGVITQNVDGLHQAAGSRKVVDLHGQVSRVRCMGCARSEDRAVVQKWIGHYNPHFDPEDAAPAPDGDADLDPAALAGFRVPPCPACGGILKPDVVFFGESVPAKDVAQAWELFDEGALLLVAGSSLAVFSGRRFVLRAERLGRPVAILNLGPTRGDQIAQLRVEGRLGELLPRLASALGVSERRAPVP